MRSLKNILLGVLVVAAVIAVLWGTTTGLQGSNEVAAGTSLRNELSRTKADLGQSQRREKQDRACIAAFKDVTTGVLAAMDKLNASNKAFSDGVRAALAGDTKTSNTMNDRALQNSVQAQQAIRDAPTLPKGCKG